MRSADAARRDGLHPAVNSFDAALIAPSNRFTLKSARDAVALDRFPGAASPSLRSTVEAGFGTPVVS